MTSSQFLAAIIGPLFLVVGVGTLLNAEYYRKMLVGFIENAGLYYFSGTLAFVIGLLIIYYHNIWTADWRVVITILGWMSLAKGAIRIVFPVLGRTAAGAFTASTRPLIAGALLLLGFGAWLTYRAFWA